MTKAGPRWTGRVELIPEKLDEPLRWRKPQRVFVNSMSDLFHEALPDEAIDRVFAVMAMCERQTFQILTKRPRGMRDYFTESDRIYEIEQRMYELGGPEDATTIIRWPLPNVWLGVSVEDQATADERIPLLLQTPAAVRFVSYEPALGPVSFRWAKWDDWKTPDGSRREVVGHLDGMRGLSWVIVGGESGPGARPFDLAWARSVLRQCREAGVPAFIKQLGARPFSFDPIDGWEPLFRDRHGREPSGEWVPQFKSPKGGDPAEWSPDLRVREFPK